jgi:predicted esterase
LQRAGYDVHYREFDGGHTVPAEIANEAMEWFTKS